MSGWCVGEYCRVSISENETRKAIVAVINDNTVDLVLLANYREETLGPDLNSVGIDRIAHLRDWETPFLCMKEMGDNYFKFFDWNGAIQVYTELLQEIQVGVGLCGGHCLFKQGISVLLGTYLDDRNIKLVGKLDPTRVVREYHHGAFNDVFAGIEYHHGEEEISFNEVFSYRIHSNIEYQVGLLLNCGRAMLQREQLEEATALFSFAIYISALSNATHLRAKSFYWRSKARLLLGRGAAALRDAENSALLGNDSCTQIIHDAKKLIQAEKNSTRKLTREIMKICQEHLHAGLIDFNI